MSSYLASQNKPQFIIIKWLSYRQRQTGSFLRLNESENTHSPTNIELQRDLRTRNKKEETELNLTKS